MGKLLKVENITIQRPGPVTYDHGEPIKGTPTTLTGRGSIQPLDRLEKGSITVEMQKDGDRSRQYCKMYTKTKIEIKDIITTANTGKVYRVHKVSNYNRYAMGTDHYKAILYFIED